MRILLYGINYLPELTGIGKYSGELAEWLVTQGHEVQVVTAPPYYPMWKVSSNYSAWRYKYEKLNQIDVYRCPVWVPRKPSGIRRIIHLLSFSISSSPALFWGLKNNPDIILVIEPPLFCAPLALIAARFSGAKVLLHVQDLEVDAAFELGLLRSQMLHKLVLATERWLMGRFDYVSTISEKMLERIVRKGVDRSKLMLFSNWVDIEQIFPLDTASEYRTEWGIGNTKVVALYSGNMGEKQGLDIVLEAAKRLVDRLNIIFVLCGEGGAKERLMRDYSYLPNVLWRELQPVDKLNQLLNLADIHLLPQRVDAADLVMPSKLVGMLASGKPIIATVSPRTEIANLIEGCGMIVPPGDTEAFADALFFLSQNAEYRSKLGKLARQVAVSKLGKHSILADFLKNLVVINKTK